MIPVLSAFKTCPIFARITGDKSARENYRKLKRLSTARAIARAGGSRHLHTIEKDKQGVDDIRRTQHWKQ